jgi:hypothetical protein
LGAVSLWTLDESRTLGLGLDAGLHLGTGVG